MGDSFAIYALRRKRARLAGEIGAAQTALNRQRDQLATLDAVIRMFEPDTNPELIAAIRPCSARCLYFRRGEQMRLCLAALREAGKPVSTRYVAEYAMGMKGLDPDPKVRDKITENVRMALKRLAAKGITRKIIVWPDTWWEIAV
jgi:hypothetical protein